MLKQQASASTSIELSGVGLSVLPYNRLNLLILKHQFSMNDVKLIVIVYHENLYIKRNTPKMSAAHAIAKLTD